MRELLLSARVFFGGILRRFYLWSPAILLDPFDFWERYARDRLPEPWRGVEVPSDLFFPTLGTMLLWAGLLTYHELRTRANQERSALQGQLDDRERRKVALDYLAGLLDTGNELFHRREMDNDAWSQWQKDLQLWTDDVHRGIQNSFSEAEAARFRNATRSGLYLWGGARDDQHNRQLNLLHARLEIVQGIIAAYSRPG